MTTHPFEPLPPTPDHNALELDLLDWWAERDIFAKLRRQNEAGPLFSFIDGPVTANKTLGVHTAWGRTLKDVVQRYKAMRGHHQRYQNGFDCQGLWIEVGVEQELGLNSKKEIEEYGLEAFARRCREKVAWSVEELIRGSQRLGYWMDWGDDYLTFSDTNIEYIWRFLKTMHDRGWVYRGHRSTEWCPRCGTSLSQHEISQSGVYQQRTDPSLFVRLPIREREGEALVVWTTTPWTLPANVAAAVHPDYEYGRRPDGDWVAVERYPDDEFTERMTGAEMVGWTYTGPFDDLPAVSGVEHRVIAWDEVTLDQGTGIVHIAPGCGSEDFELGRELGLAVLTPVDEAGRFYPGYEPFDGLTTDEARRPITDALTAAGALVEAGDYVHSYPHCWRCDTPLIFRIADDWYLAVEELRRPLLDANATVEWVPAYMGKLMDDWLQNMGDWNISRRRYYGLPLPFYPCPHCEQLTVVGSKAELGELAVEGMDQLEELHRPWVDRVLIRCPHCGTEGVSRVPEVGDVWLDAGIVPMSTLGWQSPEWVEAGNATGAAAGLTGADLPDHAYWERWFPADFVSEMREQVRLWFYSQLFMSVAMLGRAPFKRVLGYEKMLDEQGQEMHGSWGNLIKAEDAFERMGADVMRWQYCAHPPDRNLLFGYGKAQEVERKLLTVWNSAKFLIDYANIEGFTPIYDDLATGPPSEALQPIDHWLVARVAAAVSEATHAMEALRTDWLMSAFEAFVDDLSNWYIRRTRRRFYGDDDAAFRTLWYGVAQALRLIAPVMPFLADHLWRNLVAGPCREAPESVHLSGWPQPGARDEGLVGAMATVRSVVELGRRARSEADLKLRQPLRRALVHGAPAAEGLAAHIRDELRVKEVSFAAGALGELEVSLKPNFPELGPRLGSKVKEVAAALAQGDFVDGPNGVEVAGEVLAPNEVVRTERVLLDGWVTAHEGDITVALDPEVDDELRLEGRAHDLIRAINDLRKQRGLELTDRIVLRLPDSYRDVVAAHEPWIADEVLARSVEVSGEVAEPDLEVAG